MATISGRKARLYLIVSLVFMLFSVLRVFAQADDEGKRVKEQAEKLVAALIKNDWKTFGHYSNPAILKAVGGVEQMEKRMGLVIDNMKAQGMSWHAVKIGDASKIITYDAELQCTIPQTTEINTSKGLAVIRSTLVGISVNGGKDWTFFDTVHKTVADARQVWPHLSPEIVIPPTEESIKGVY